MKRGYPVNGIDPWYTDRVGDAFEVFLDVGNGHYELVNAEDAFPGRSFEGDAYAAIPNGLCLRLDSPPTERPEVPYIRIVS